MLSKNLITISFNKMMRQNSLFSAILKGVTLGIINIGSDGVIIKDPVTGVGNILAHLRDGIFSSLNQGVWMGKRTIDNSGIGFSSYLTEVINTTPLHYAFMVDGRAFHLTQENGEPLAIKQLTEEKKKFEWFYKGKSNRTMAQVLQLIQRINNMVVQHNLIISDYTSTVKAIIGYARSVFDQQQTIKIIQLTVRRPAIVIAQQIKNLFIP